MDGDVGDRYESLPERLIREATEAGELDDLPDSGKPLSGAGRPDDDLWWVRRWMQQDSNRLEGER